MTIGIYMIRNTIDNKVYIGKSIDIRNRWKQHRDSLNNNKHKNPYLQNSWKKYGEESFRFWVLEICPPGNDNNLTMREYYWIDKYNSFHKDFGYNISYPVPSNNHRIDRIKIDIDTFFQIRDKLINTNLKQKEIANEFGVTNELVSYIKKGKHALNKYLDIGPTTRSP